MNRRNKIKLAYFGNYNAAGEWKDIGAQSPLEAAGGWRGVIDRSARGIGGGIGYWAGMPLQLGANALGRLNNLARPRLLGQQLQHWWDPQAHAAPVWKVAPSRRVPSWLHMDPDATFNIFDDKAGTVQGSLSRLANPFVEGLVNAGLQAKDFLTNVWHR